MTADLQLSMARSVSVGITMLLQIYMELNLVAVTKLKHIGDQECF